MLSRNFRLQKVGDINWLRKNYDFSKIAFYIDELVVLDVSRKSKDLSKFSDVLKSISEGCFAPISAGGGITSFADAKSLLRAGADKIVVNSLLHESPDVVIDLSKDLGQQCIVGAIDFKLSKDNVLTVHSNNGERALKIDRYIERFPSEHVGEIYINSIDRDGTGQGYEFKLLDWIPQDWSMPIILAGGVGNSDHLLQGLKDERIDAVATAHLFNFVGNGLQKARQNIINSAIPLASWPSITEIILTFPRPTSV